MLALNLVVRNEHDRLVRCLARAALYCDELVVVDQESDDDTRDIARSFGALVVEDECRGFPEPSRPLAARVTKAEWILVLDADEHVVDQAIPEMLEIAGDNSYLGVRFSRGCYIDGERQLERADGTYHPDIHLRMFRKGCVDYGLQLHDRIEMKNSGLSTKLLPQRPAIRNERTHTEWEETAARVRGGAAMNPEMTLLFVPGAEIGYGRLGVYLDIELKKRGVTIYNDDGNPGRKQTIRERQLNGQYMAETPTNLMCYVSVPSHMVGYWKGQHRAFITMWEAMTLPEDFRSMFHEIDTLIVPSEHNMELFGRFHDNVHYMPLGVDPELWHYIPPSPPTTHFNFMISGRGDRKGNDLVFKAFREVFRPGTPLKGPAPRLIMKSLRGHNSYFGVTGVDQITGKLSPVEERDLYASAHCYLQPSRGEGFGLQPLQAIALGRPTILTAAHGHASYADLGIGLSSTPSEASYFIYGDAGNWWEPSYDELCEAMWDVYQNYDAHAERAKKSAEVVAERWTWSNVCDRYLEILGPEMVKPYTGDSTWHDITRNLFRIVLIRDYACDIAGRRLIFDKGVEYWESSDVKRTLFDAGMLDPVCIGDDDRGLAEVQVQQLDHYRAQHRDCPTCLQPINAQPTGADRIELEMMQEELDQAHETITRQAKEISNLERRLLEAAI